MAPLTRVLLIGADSADPALIERWGSEGLLPNIMALKARGAWGRIENPRGLVSGSLWPTLHTGINPAGQPQFDGLRHFNPERYEFDYYRASEVAEPLWRVLSRAGKRCFVMDAPYSFAEEINGICIVDWGAHVPARGGETMAFTAFPKEAGEELLRVVGPDPTGGIPCDNRLPDTLEDHRRFLDVHLERIGKKAAAARHFLSKGGWDFFEVVFCDLHCVGHHLWHVNDRRHPRYSPSLEKALGEPLKACYRALDAAVGEILALLDEQTLVVLYASHGIGPQYTGTGLLDRILYNLEFDVRSRPAAPTLEEQLREFWWALPAGVRARIRPLKNRLFGPPARRTFLPGRQHRRFFEVYATNGAGGVRVNLKGRERHGLVEPEDYDALLDRLASDLSEVVNVESGEPLVEEIVKTHDCYAGPYLDRLPDLAVVWNRNYPIRLVASPKIGILKQAYADARTGDHTPDGAFFAHGPDVRPGWLNHAVTPADFAPTIRLALGLDEGHSEGVPIRPLVAARRVPAVARAV